MALPVKYREMYSCSWSCPTIPHLPSVKQKCVCVSACVFLHGCAFVKCSKMPNNTDLTHHLMNTPESKNCNPLQALFTQYMRTILWTLFTLKTRNKPWFCVSGRKAGSFERRALSSRGLTDCSHRPLRNHKSIPSNAFLSKQNIWYNFCNVYYVDTRLQMLPLWGYVIFFFKNTVITVCLKFFIASLKIYTDNMNPFRIKGLYNSSIIVNPFGLVSAKSEFQLQGGTISCQCQLAPVFNSQWEA